MTSPYEQAVDAWLPDEYALKELERLLRHRRSLRTLLDEAGNDISVPDDAPLTVWSKSVICGHQDRVFAPCFRIVIAIGTMTTDGVTDAEYGFCTLWYNNTLKLVTSDFDSSWFPDQPPRSTGSASHPD